jgi:hypothetical protein
MAERAHPCAYGPRADEDDFFAGLALLGDLRHQLFHLRKVRLLAAIGQDAGAELYDQPRNVFQEIRAHKINLPPQFTAGSIVKRRME